MAVFHSRLLIMISHDSFPFSYSNFNFSYSDFLISRSDFPISHSDFSITHIDHWDSIGDFQLNPLLSCLACHSNHKFSEGIFSAPVNFRPTSKLFGSQGCSDDKNWLDFSSILFKISRLCSSILLSLQVFIQGGATLKSGLTVARFFSTNHDSLVRIATNDIASFWIDQITSNGFFSCKGRPKAGQKAGFRVCWNILR